METRYKDTIIKQNNASQGNFEQIPQNLLRDRPTNFFGPMHIVGLETVLDASLAPSMGWKLPQIWIVGVKHLNDT